MEIRYILQSRSCFPFSVEKSQGPREEIVIVDCYSSNKLTLVQYHEVYRKEEVKDKKLEKIFFLIQGPYYLTPLPTPHSIRYVPLHNNY